MKRERAPYISGDPARCYVNDIISNHNAPIMPGDVKGLNTDAFQQYKNFLSHSGTRVIPVRFARLTIPLQIKRNNAKLFCKGRNLISPTGPAFWNSME